MSSYHDLGYSTGKQSTHKALTCYKIFFNSKRVNITFLNISEKDGSTVL